MKSETERHRGRAIIDYACADAHSVADLVVKPKRELKRPRLKVGGLRGPFQLGLKKEGAALVDAEFAIAHHPMNRVATARFVDGETDFTSAKREVRLSDPAGPGSEHRNAETMGM